MARNQGSFEISRSNPQDSYELIQKIGSGTYGDVYKVMLGLPTAAIVLFIELLASCGHRWADSPCPSWTAIVTTPWRRKLGVIRYRLCKIRNFYSGLDFGYQISSLWIVQSRTNGAVVCCPMANTIIIIATAVFYYCVVVVRWLLLLLNGTLVHSPVIYFTPTLSIHSCFC